MVPMVSIKSMPCPDPDCIDGKIVVYNIYDEDPLVGEEQPCGLCRGGYIVTEDFSNN